MEQYAIRRIGWIYVLYVVLLSFFSMRMHVQTWIVLMQFVLATEFVLACILLKKAKPISFVVVSGILMAINIIFIRLLFSAYGVHPFGPYSADSVKYMLGAFSGISMSLTSYIDYLIKTDMGVDNFGMCFIARWAAKLGGSESGYIMTLSFFNIIAISLSTLYINKISRLFIESQAGNLATLIWGLHHGFLGFAVWGLKENFFLLFVVIVIYYILKNYKRRNVLNLLLAVLFASITILFRYAVCAQILLALGGASLFSSLKRHKVILLGSFLIVGYIFLSNIEVLLYAVGATNGLEGFIQLAEGTESSLSVNQSYGIQLLYAIIGAPSNFGGKIGFNHLMSFVALLCAFMTIYFVLGVFVAFKKENKMMLFLLFYWVFGMGMLVMAFRGSDFRFATLYFPSFILLSAVGYEHRNEFSKNFLDISTLVLTMVILSLILAWNT